jgi:hypothetical protein
MFNTNTATRPPTKQDVLDALARELETEPDLSVDDVIANRRAELAKAQAPMSEEQRRAKANGVFLKVLNELGDDGKQVFDEIAGSPPPSVIGSQTRQLGALMREGIPEIEYLPSPSLGEDFFPAFSLLKVNGHAKTGKSWTMALLAADHVRAGRPVLYLDQENGEEIIAERLKLLDLNPDDVDRLFLYEPFPASIPPIERLREDVEGFAATRPGVLLIIDSMRTCMARYGLNPNVEVDIEAFLGSLMGAVKAHKRQISIAVIDHSNRQTKAGDTYAAAGSAAKMAAVDADYYFEREEYFSEERRGLVKIVVKGDRRGRIKDTERHYRVGGQGAGASVVFERVDNDEVGTFGKVKRECVDFLSDRTGERFTSSAVESKVTGDRNTIRTALKALASEAGHIHCEPNPTRSGSILYFHDSGGLSLDGGPMVSNDR